MKKMKKALAILMAMTMVLGMSMTAFAEGKGTKPLEEDAKEATVQNVEKEATVTAYQIVKANYNSLGFTGYEIVNGVEIADDQTFKPTSDEITAIATQVKNGKLQTLKQKTLIPGAELQDTEGNPTGLADFTANLNAGYWMVLVTGSVSEVYNPMLVGVYYKTEGTGQENELDTKPVDANSNWKLETTDAYAKSTKPTLDKKIVDSDGNESGNDVAIGDIVKYQIDTALPSYSAEYKKVVVKITDTLTEGLTYQKDTVKVKVGDTEVMASEATYELNDDEMGTEGGGSFVITFNSDYAIANGGKAVCVTYEAKLNEKAHVNFDFNKNTAELEYSNNSSNEADTEKIDDRTYTYTFGIDANLNGSNSETWQEITKELIKTDEGEIKEIVDEVTGETTWEYTPLKDAEFSLTKLDENGEKTEVVKTTSSDDKGYLTFIGLDAGEYILQETKAPEGYTLNQTEIPVKITASYNDDGTLKSYEIEVNGEKTSTYTATYEGEHITKIVNKDNLDATNGDTISDTHFIKNTKLSELPSTGGIGTTIFTIGGCIIMIAAAGLFFASRRKTAK